MPLRSAVHSFRRAERGAVEAAFHLHMVKQVGTPPRTGERSKPLGRGEGAKAHTAELQRVSRVGSMVQRSIHNSGQVELLFFNVTLTMSQA